MTNLKQILGFNIKQHRTRLGLTQVKLAEKAEVSTQYFAMIELGRKFPSLELMDRIAAVLGIDSLDLFTPPPFPAANMDKFQKSFLADMEKEVSKSITKAIQKAVKTVISSYTMEDKKG